MPVPTCGTAAVELRGFAVRVAGAQRGEVRVANRRLLRELLADPLLDRRDLAVEHPLHEPERPEILAATGVALAQPELTAVASIVCFVMSTSTT